MNKKPVKKNPKKPKNDYRNILFAVLVGLMLLLGFSLMNNDTDNSNEPTLSEIVQMANSGEVKQITFVGENQLEVELKDEDSELITKNIRTEQSLEGLGLEISEENKNQDLKIDTREADTSGEVISSIAITLLPVLLIGGLLFWMMRSAQGQGSQAMSFGRSKARLYGNEKKEVKFEDIAGSNEAKEDLEEIVQFLKFPKKFESVGARIPKGMLLVGPPGTGKTMLARAVAGEAGVPFFSISGSEFVEMFVGVGASRVRDLFTKAKKNAPCIIFIDEIDAVGRKRGSGMGGGHDEREQTLNQILVEMDGFEQGENVIVLAATNRSDVLDPALLRPGRFDRRVNITLPDRKDREAILKVHFKKKPVESDVDLDALAAKSAGSSGADLANIANESAIVAAKHNRKVITNGDVTAAFEKVAIGPERRGKIMSDKEKELTAYHEAGHALVGHVMPDSDMVHKVTIISRGSTGGVTWFIPPEDKSYHSIVEYKDVLARMLGGRIAEKIIYGDDRVTTGAGNDLQKAAELARDMITNQGMGKKLRNQVFHTDDGMMMERIVHERQYSDVTAKLIDDEVEELIIEAANRAENVIKANKDKLEALKDALIEKETVEAEEVLEILKGSKLPSNAKLASV